MTRIFDKLNLRPQERRLVIAVAVVVFVGLNWFFVKPYFGELGRVQQKMVDAERNIKRFNDEIQRQPIYQTQKNKLSQQGGQVPTEEQASSLTREVNNQAGTSGVNVGTLVPAPHSRDGRTNSFYEEQAVNLTFGSTGEPELINFLYSLASQKSLIRVKSMVLRHDAGRTKLAGTLTLVESFQKKAPAKSAAASKPANVPAKTTNAAPKATAQPATTSAPPKAKDAKNAVVPPAPPKK